MIERLLLRLKIKQENKEKAILEICNYNSYCTSCKHCKLKYIPIGGLSCRYDVYCRVRKKCIFECGNEAKEMCKYQQKKN